MVLAGVGPELEVVLDGEVGEDAAPLGGVGHAEAQDLVRKGEDIYREKYAGKSLTDSQWIAAMVRDPVLIERPIVVRGKRATIGRPPENVEQLLR